MRGKAVLNTKSHSYTQTAIGLYTCKIQIKNKKKKKTWKMFKGKTAESNASKIKCI